MVTREPVPEWFIELMRAEVAKARRQHDRVDPREQDHYVGYLEALDTFLFIAKDNNNRKEK